MEKSYKTNVTYIVLIKGFNIMEYKNASSYFTVE